MAEYKYKILQIILVACVMVGLSACSSVTVRPYGGEKDTTEPDYKASKSFYLGWLIGEHEVNVSEICGDRRVMQMQTVNSLSDLMQSFLSVLIYTPRTAKVWCEESGAGEIDG